MSRNRLERETTITFNEAEDTATVWTASPVVHRRLAKRGIMPMQESQGASPGEASWSYQLPKKWVRIYPARRKRQLPPAKA
jgi:predicted secreted protein